ncbi:MAG TPA: hypothetical protein VF475_00650 [Sphingobium sp.]
MLRTLAFLGVAAVAYKQLKKSGSIDGFKADLKRRADDLRSYVDEQRTASLATPVNPNSTAGAPQPAGAGTATI